jgi:C-terminal processing protease CtpA/Prc
MLGLTMQGQTTLVGRTGGRREESPLVIAEIEPGGPAERAGLRVGDELLAVDGASATGLATLQAALVLRGFHSPPVRLLVARREGGADERLELIVQPEVR